MDIIVTTPKGRMAEATKEAEDVKRAGGGEYFRRFSMKPPVEPGDRVFYVEDGYIRGFAVAARVEKKPFVFCGTTFQTWPAGWFIYMDATTWKWIRPIPMKGFQGYRLAHKYLVTLETQWIPGPFRDVKIIGDWLDPKPEV